MKFNDVFENDGGWNMEVISRPSGTMHFTISIKERSRHWRREEISLSKEDAIKLREYLAAKTTP